MIRHISIKTAWEEASIDTGAALWGAWADGPLLRGGGGVLEHVDIGMDISMGYPGGVRFSAGSLTICTRSSSQKKGQHAEHPFSTNILQEWTFHEFRDHLRIDRPERQHQILKLIELNRVIDVSEWCRRGCKTSLAEADRFSLRVV